MTNNLANQNLRLLQAVHCQIPFLKKFSSDQLSQLANKSHFFVFSSATVIAQEKQSIDFIGVILQGKVSVTGDTEKKGSGYSMGELGFCGILDRHAVSVIGDSDGIVMALRFEDINKMDKAVKAVLNNYAVQRSLQILKKSGENEALYLPQQIQQRRVSHLFTQPIKILLNDTLDPKEKQLFLKYFPILQITSKMKIIDKKQQPFLLITVKGQLIIKSQNQNIPVKLMPGQMFNCEGFLLNYSPNANVYCFSEQAVVIKILRRQAENLLDVATMQKIDNFLLRKEINDKKYEVITSQLRREREKQATKSGSVNSKWSIFTKQNYEIIPLTIPKKSEKQKPKTSAQSQKEQRVMISTLFREQLQQAKNQKTNSSANSKINKVITMKTEKAEEKSNSVQQQLKDLRKQMEVMGSKIKYYEDNYTKCHLEMVEYRAKYQMAAVFKQINELGDKKFRNKNGAEITKVLSLKKAFEEHMKENRIMQVVARCAYRWLWAVRKKKGLSKFRTSMK